MNIKDYGKKITDLDFKYDIGLRATEYKQIVAKHHKINANFGSESEWLLSIDSMMESIRHDPLKREMKEQALAISQMCPVCQKPSEPITLMRNRKAYYCKAHRAVSPAIVNE
jgi:hypothetical protein